VRGSVGGIRLRGLVGVLWFCVVEQWDVVGGGFCLRALWGDFCMSRSRLSLVFMVSVCRSYLNVHERCGCGSGVNMYVMSLCDLMMFVWISGERFVARGRYWWRWS